MDSLSEYATSTECRAIVLRRYFGESDGEPCGLCDICRGRPERPSSFWEPIVQPERKKKKKRRPSRRRRKGKKGAAPAVDLSAPLDDPGSDDALMPLDEMPPPSTDLD